MEKTTDRQEPPALAPTSAAGWARAALAGIIAVTPQWIVVGTRGEQDDEVEAPERGSSPRRRNSRSNRPRPSTRWGPHRHAVVELCLPLFGAARLALADRVADLAPGTLAILPPKVEHYEAARRRGAGGYALLWILPASASISWSVSRFDPGKGWDCPWRYRSAHPAGHHLHGLLDGIDRPSARSRLDGLLADLLAILADAHRELAIVEGPGAGPAQPDPHEAAVALVRGYVDAHLDQPLTLRELADLAYLSPNHLNALFRRREGCGIHQYLITRRMEKAMQLCREGRWLIKQIAEQTGYADPLYFSRAFHRWHGRWPSQVRPDRAG